MMAPSPRRIRALKKWKWLLIACALVLVVGAMMFPIACGPQKKFCPNTPTGDCPIIGDPQNGGAGGGGGGISGDSIVFD
jgi:hypothetical protein